MRKYITISVLLFSIICFSYADEGDKPKSYVVTLTESNFDDVINQNEYVLVEFYAPWCGHCKKLAPEYEIAAKRLRDRKDIVLAKVDATVETSLATKFNIRGYPTLKLFKQGKFHSDYRGGRISLAIVNFLEKVTGPASDQLNTNDDFEKFLAKESLTHIVAFVPEDKVQAFTEAIDNMEFPEISFAHVTSNELTESLKQKQGTIVVYEKGEVINTYSGELTPESIKHFIERKGYPILEKLVLTPEFVERLQKKIKPLVAVARKQTDKMSLEEQYEFARKLALESGVEAIFAEFESADNPRLVKNWGASGEVFPTVFTLKFVEDRPVISAFNEEKELTFESAVEFIKSCLYGDECDANIKSEPIPKKNDGPVKVIVGKTFKDIVYDQTKDVVVEFYSPTCPHCKKIEEPYYKFGQLYENDDTVVVAKIDATVNSYPETLPVTGYPTILLFKANDKEHPIKFEGERTTERFQEFVEKNRTFKKEESNTKDEL